jgi:hypothetical protein
MVHAARAEIVSFCLLLKIAKSFNPHIGEGRDAISTGAIPTAHQRNQRKVKIKQIES